MRNPTHSRMLTFAALAATGLISGCSSLPFVGDDERQPNRAAQLEVPPAFSGPAAGGSVALPEIASARAEARARDEESGVASQGETKSEALINLADALELHSRPEPDDEELEEADAPWF